MGGVAVDRSFWAGRRVLVTGHTGFKGSWLALWLSQMGAEVHGIALDPETATNHFDLAGIGAVMSGDMRLDLRDAAGTAAAVARAAPEVVFHLAAQPLVRRAYRAPLETFATNVMGTAHLLEALRLVEDCRVCIAVTTDKVYDNREWAWPYRETDTLGGHEPYGTSKAAAEMVIQAWQRSFFGPQGRGLVAVRAGNVIGGGDWSEDRLVPDFVRAACARQPVVIRNPDAVRPWQHVLEPLKGYLIAAERLWADYAALPPALNFGPDAGDFRSVRDIVERFVQHWGAGASWQHVPDGTVRESRLLTLDNALAREVLGWRPVWDFDACIARTIDWYRVATRPSADVASLSCAEIAAFEKDYRS